MTYCVLECNHQHSHWEHQKLVNRVILCDDLNLLPLDCHDKENLMEATAGVFSPVFSILQKSIYSLKSLTSLHGLARFHPCKSLFDRTYLDLQHEFVALYL